jgi:class 3 adenylate cyclase
VTAAQSVVGGPTRSSRVRRLASMGRLVGCDLRGWGSFDTIDLEALPALQAGARDSLRSGEPRRRQDHRPLRSAGLHTGEVELRGGDVAGLAVHIGARIASLADADEILVSASVPPLVAGSGIASVTRSARTEGSPRRMGRARRRVRCVTEAAPASGIWVPEPI